MSPAFAESGRDRALKTCENRPVTGKIFRCPDTNPFLSFSRENYPMDHAGFFLVILVLSAGFFIPVAGSDGAGYPSPAAGRVEGAGPGLVPVLSPVSPEFLEFRNRSSSRVAAVPAIEKKTILYRNGSQFPVFLNGEIPSPQDFSSTRGISPARAMSPGSDGTYYPPVFDLRTKGKVSPVRDQGSAGSCWAFASYGSLESSLLKGQVWDLSENNMKNRLAFTYPDGFDRTWDGGGNRFMSAAYLARWSGPVTESADPYGDASGFSPAGLHTVMHVQNISFLPERARLSQTSFIKDALMAAGAVQASIYYDSGFYNASSFGFYNPVISPDTNHAITLIGWDDAYSRTNFVTPPPADGAFLARNSWGTWWGKNGYFYISYYDLTVGDKCAVFTASPEPVYDRQYSYDPLGWIYSLGYENQNTALFANVYSARSAETLNAIGVYDTYPGNFTARIYLDPKNGPVNASGPVAMVSWKDTLLGYRTITTPQVALRPGQKFSVVVTASTHGSDYPVPIEYPEPGYSSHATAKAGQGYVSDSGTTWTDMTGVFPGTSVCVKAFTNQRSRVGVFRPSVQTFFLQNGSVNMTVFGRSTDIPISGDWNGDGMWDIGVFRPSDHTFRLKNGTGTTVISFGQATDLPLTGDWNGDGMWDIGVFRPATNTFLLRNGTITTTIRFGYRTDLPVTGDWNGDGLWEIGIFRNTSGAFYLKTGSGYTTVMLGGPRDLPVTGDWDGDGRWDVGVYRSSIAAFFQKTGTAVTGIRWGQPGDIPVTGKWS